MSALLSVAPRQNLKIANRTKMDGLEDEDEDEHEMPSLGSAGIRRSADGTGT